MWHPYRSISFLGSGVPPAPIFKVTLLNSERHDNRIYELDALLDTGADVTLIPLEAVSVLRLSILDNKVPVVGVGGAMTMGYPCRVDLQFEDVKLPLIEVISCEAAAIGMQGLMIIGRDVLNQFCVKFDGKRQQFSFEFD